MSDTITKARNAVSLVAMAGVAVSIAGAAMGSLSWLVFASALTATAGVVKVAMRPKPEPAEVQQEFDFTPPQRKPAPVLSH